MGQEGHSRALVAPEQALGATLQERGSFLADDGAGFVRPQLGTNLAVGYFGSHDL